MKKWEVRAELNMNASHYETKIIKANTERKALMFAEEQFKKDGAFFITNMSAKEIKEGI